MSVISTVAGHFAGYSAFQRGIAMTIDAVC